MTVIGGLASIDSLRFQRKSRSLLEVFAMREDMMDIEMIELETFVPGRIFMPFSLKAKTTKTTR
jgi:hypothetical protein